jgi:hypothetical protein
MGNDFNFLVTPFLKCRTPLVDLHKEQVSCTNKDCSKYGEYAYDKFCSKCGSKIDKITVNYRGPKANGWWLADEIDMRLWCRGEAVTDGETEIHIWLPNLRPTFKTFSADENDNKPFEIFDFSFEKEKAKFETQYKEDIEFLKSKYDECSIEYGIVRYWG